MKKAQWENWLNVILGAWLFLTPWTLTNTLTVEQGNMVNWNAWIVGAVVVISAFMALQDMRPWEEWINLILGVWLLLSPWIYGYSTTANLTWNSVIVGLAIAVFSGIALPIAMRPIQQSPRL